MSYLVLVSAGNVESDTVFARLLGILWVLARATDFPCTTGITA